MPEKLEVRQEARRVKREASKRSMLLNMFVFCVNIWYLYS
jgi:hypothetical protein